MYDLLDDDESSPFAPRVTVASAPGGIAYVATTTAYGDLIGWERVGRAHVLDAVRRGERLLKLVDPETPQFRPVATVREFLEQMTLAEISCAQLLPEEPSAYQLFGGWTWGMRRLCAMRLRAAKNRGRRCRDCGRAFKGPARTTVRCPACRAARQGG